MDKATFISAMRTAGESIRKANESRNRAIREAWAANLHGEGGKKAFVEWALATLADAGVKVGPNTLYNALKIGEVREAFPQAIKADETLALRIAETVGKVEEGEREAFVSKAMRDGVDAARAAHGIAKPEKGAGEREAGAAESTAKAESGKVGTADAAKAIRAILARTVPADLADARDFADAVAAATTAWMAGLDFGAAKPTRRKAKASA